MTLSDKMKQKINCIILRAGFLLLLTLGFTINVNAQYASWIAHPIYDQVLEYDGNMAAVKRDGKWGFINEKGEEVVECLYDQVSPFCNGISIATTADNKIQATINSQGTVINEFKNQNGQAVVLYLDSRYPNFSNERLLVTDKKTHEISGVERFKWGYLGVDGSLKIPIQYFAAMPFCEGRAGVANEKMRYCYIDAAGNEIITEKEINSGRSVLIAGGFRGGSALICDKKGFAYIDLEGKRLDANNHSFSPKIEYIDLQGNILEGKEGKLEIDSFGRLISFTDTEENIMTFFATDTEKAPIKSDMYFILQGKRVDKDTEWVSPNKAKLKHNGRYGVIEVTKEPLISFEVKGDSVSSIFGNVEPSVFSFKNNSMSDISNVVIEIDGEANILATLPISGYNKTIENSKLTSDAEESFLHKVKISQYGLLMMSDECTIKVYDKPSIVIDGNIGYEYNADNGTFKISVKIENTSNYHLSNAQLMINNYHENISIAPNFGKTVSSVFLVEEGASEIKLEIVINADKSQPVTKSGRIPITD